MARPRNQPPIQPIWPLPNQSPSLPKPPLMTNSSQSDSSIIPATEEPGAQMTFFEHLVELRKRLINSLASIVIGAMAGWFVAPRFIATMTKPMSAALSDNGLDPHL